MDDDVIRILLVEDDRGDALLMGEALAEAGPGRFTLEHADRMSSAMTRLDEGGVDLVLLDLTLPDSQGLDSFHTLHSRAELVPVIVLTGLDDESLALVAVEEGAQDYLIKGQVQADLLARSVRYSIGRSRAEQALRESESALRAFLDSAPMMMGVAEVVGDDVLFVSPNAYMARYLGLPLETLRGRLASGLGVPRERTAGWVALYHESRRTGLPARCEFLDASSHGPRWLSATVSHLAGAPHGGARFSYVAEDVTARKETEEALRVSEARFARAIRGTCDGIWDWLCLTEEVYYSPRFKGLLGYEDREFPDTLEGFISRLHPEDKARICDALTAHCERRVPYDVEYRLLTKSGEYRWFHARGQAEWDEAMRPTRMAGSISDITGRKCAEREHARLAAILDATTDFVGMADPSGRAVYLNRGGRQMVGRREEEIPRSVISDYHPAWADEIVRTEALKTALIEGTWSGELAVLGRDGCELPVSAVILPLKNSHGDTEVFAYNYRDISDRKLAEQEIRTLNAHLERRLEHLSALRTIDAAINTSLDLRQTLDVVINQVVSQLRADAVIVRLCAPNTGSLTYAAGRGFHAPAMMQSLPLDDSVVGQVVRDLRPLHLKNLADSCRPFVHAEAIAEEGFEGYSAMPLVSRGKCLGVLEVFQRASLEPQPEWLNFLAALADQAAIAVANFSLFEGLQRSNLELTLAYDSTIDGWSRALDLRDKETEGHSQRVTAMTICLARTFGYGDADLLVIRRGALLHDIGKLGVPDAILLKPGPLTEDEWEVMRRHPTYAHDWLSPIEFLRTSLEIPYCHHEKWDGSGYPRGLKGEQIPFAARIFAAVDICDALLSDRPYRKGWPVEKVREHIRLLSGSHLDPRVVEAFLPMISEFGRPVPAGSSRHLGVREAGAGEADSELLGAAFRAMLEHSDDFVVLLDGSWQVQAASRSFITAFAPGLSPRGLDFIGLLDSGSRDKFRTLLNRPLGGSLTLELNHLAPSNALRLVEYTFCELSRPPGTRLLAAVGRGQEASLELVETLVLLNQELEESRRSLSELALSDPLTGLGNRRWLFDQLEALWAQGRRQDRLPWVMMADLDHFKGVNDTYGHQAGDEVLLAASREMRASIRTEDLVARYGGEEFVMAGLCDRESEPLALAVRVRDAIRDLRVECPGGPLRVTTSIGVALADPDASNPPWVVLQSADRALYRAKAGGRDRIEAEPGVVGRRASLPAGGEVMGRIGFSYRSRVS